MKIKFLSKLNTLINSLSKLATLDPILLRPHTALGRVKEYNDFNNVTLAYEDDSQVRFTKSSFLHPVNNWYKIQPQKVKVNSNRYSLKWKNGVQRSKGTLFYT